MNCREAKFWVFSCRPGAAWPAEVVTHLQLCTDCHALRAELKQLDQGISKIGRVPSKNGLKAQILARIDKTPQLPGSNETRPIPRWQWQRIGLYLAGSAALVLFGWFLGRPGDVDSSGNGPQLVRERLVEQVADKSDNIATVSAPSDRTLFTLLLKHNARLVQGSQTVDRLITLLDMASDCRQHALSLIDHGPRDSLLLTVELYVRLLRDGVLMQVASAPQNNRPMLQATARTRLGQMAETAAAPKPLPQVVEDQRVIIREATRQTMELVDRPEAIPMPAPGKKVLPDSSSPSAALVLYAVTFSSEPDPLAKADSCADCVQHLMPHMMLFMAEDTLPQQTEMGEQFGELINQGVYAPLEIATAKDPPKQVREKAERIFEKTSKTVTALEKNWQLAAAHAKIGLERAMEANKKNWEKNKGKTRALPWKKSPFQNLFKKGSSDKGGKGGKGGKKGKVGHQSQTPQESASIRDHTYELDVFALRPLGWPFHGPVQAMHRRQTFLPDARFLSHVRYT